MAPSILLVKPYLGRPLASRQSTLIVRGRLGRSARRARSRNSSCWVTALHVGPVGCSRPLLEGAFELLTSAYDPKLRTQRPRAYSSVDSKQLLRLETL